MKLQANISKLITYLTIGIVIECATQNWWNKGLYKFQLYKHAWTQEICYQIPLAKEPKARTALVGAGVVPSEFFNRGYSMWTFVYNDRWNVHSAAVTQR